MTEKAQEATLTLPMPPSANACFGNRQKGQRGPGRYVTPEYAKWRRSAEQAIQAAGRMPRFSGAVEIEIRVAEPDGHRRHDADNRVKPTVDFLVKIGIIIDDCRKIVRKCSVAWADVAPGTIEVTIRAVEYQAPVAAPKAKPVRGKSWAIQQLKRKFGIEIAPERIRLQ
jgi:Holliday junction resolvase RusA-like endonuclease